MLDKNTFYFLGEKGDLDKLGWDNPEKSKLWRYNLHYFDDLNAKKAYQRKSWHLNLLRRWVNENIPYYGSGWEPYPTSLRIVNWIKWQHSGNILPYECLNSLAVQSRWLSKKIEWHLLGNHLFSNAKSLIFAGLFFKGKEAESWLIKGLEIVKKELPEQILSDGGNFERSPMYHAIFLEDLLDLVNISVAYCEKIPKKQTETWRETAQRMLAFLNDMCHPDGEVSFFNDSAIGIAPSLKELKNYAERLNISQVYKFDKTSSFCVRQYPDTGYIRVQTDFFAAILDVAMIGPNYLPGHAHADTLSFELSIFGRRIIVNCGTSVYGNGPVRCFERGTSSHSTVEINGKNSSDVWSGFRVGKRAFPRDLRVIENEKDISISCAHNGYQGPYNKLLHHREWKFTQNKIIIKDQIFGKFDNAIARFYLHPNIKISKKRQNVFYFKIKGHSVTLNIKLGNGEIDCGYYASGFGKRVKTNCLKVNFENCNITILEIFWEG